MNPRRALALTAGALLAGALPVPTASAATSGAVLPAVERTLTASGSSAAACATGSASGPGMASAAYTAPMSGYLTVRLKGSGDWDLLLRDGAGRAGGASQSFGGSEVVQTWIDAGERVTAQGCRRAGAGRRAALSFTFADLRPAAEPDTSSVVRVQAGAKGQAALDRLGLDVTESRSATWADVIVHGSKQLELVKRAGRPFETRIPDLAAHDRLVTRRDRSFAARLGTRASALPSGRSAYRTYEEIQAELKQLVAANKGLVRPIVLGKSYQGREITGLEIATDVAGKDGRPVFFLMGVHHAREWPSAEIAMEYAQLLTKSASDPRIAKLLATTRVVVVPLVNPDGYVVSRSSPSAADTIFNTTGDGTAQTGESVAPPGGVGAYRRKNCNNGDGNPSTPCEAASGVDNNRNYGNLWGGPGASSDLTSQSYHGPSPRSELETQAVFNYARTHHVTTLVSLHTVAALVLRPPGLKSGGKAPDEAAMKVLGDAMGKAAGYESQFGFQLYDTAGTTEDDTYASTGGYGYTIEIGPSNGAFHGPYETNVVSQWTGDNDAARQSGGGGLREALLLAAETAGNPASHAQLVGTAPAGKVLRLRKDFDTLTSRFCVRGVEPVVSGPIPPNTACPEGVKDPLTLKDSVDFKTTVPATGAFQWHVGQSTRPFVNGGALIETAKEVKPPIATFTGLPGQPTGSVDQEFTLPADLGSADKVRVALTSTLPEDYDLEILLKEGSGTPTSVATSGNAPGSDEQVVIEAPKAGATYIARVNYFAAATGQYQIKVVRIAVTSKVTTGRKEAYLLTCETPAGKVLETLRLVIDRKNLVGLRLGCGKGPSFDAAGNPLDTSLTGPLPNSGPSVGGRPVPLGQVQARPFRARLTAARRAQHLRKVLRHGFIAVRCALTGPGTCTVTARIGKRRLGSGRVRMKRANTRTAKVKLSKRARALIKRSGRVRFSLVGRSASGLRGTSKLAFTVRRRR